MITLCMVSIAVQTFHITLCLAGIYHLSSLSYKEAFFSFFFFQFKSIISFQYYLVMTTKETMTAVN